MDENQLIHKLIDIFEYKSSYQFQRSTIQPQDMYVLEKIYFESKIKIRDISKQYSIPPSTLTGIIDRLELKKCIKRIRDNRDRRSVGLIITDIGKEIVENHLREDKLFAQNLFNSLQTDKKELLKELLTELVNNVKKENLFADNKN